MEPTEEICQSIALSQIQLWALATKYHLNDFSNLLTIPNLDIPNITYLDQLTTTLTMHTADYERMFFVQNYILTETGCHRDIEASLKIQKLWVPFWGDTGQMERGQAKKTVHYEVQVIIDKCYWIYSHESVHNTPQKYLHHLIFPNIFSIDFSFIVVLNVS